MPQVDLIRGFTLVRKDGSAVAYAAGLTEVDAQDADHYMVRGLTRHEGERIAIFDGFGSVVGAPVASVDQGVVAPVGQEPTGTIAVPTGGGSAPTEGSKPDPRARDRRA